MKHKFKGFTELELPTGRIQHFLQQLRLSAKPLKALRDFAHRLTAWTLTHPRSASLDSSAFPSSVWDGSCQLFLTSDHQGAEVASSARTSDKAVHFSSRNAKGLALLAHTKVRHCHPKPCLTGRAVSNHPSRDHTAFYQGSVDQHSVGMKQ